MSEHDAWPALPSRRDILLGSLMAAAAGVAWLRMPRQTIPAIDAGSMETSFPDALNTWRIVANDGLIIPPEQQTRVDNVYSHVLTRSYQRGDDPLIMLLVAYDPRQDGMLQIHRPEACYPAQGFTLSNERAVKVGLSADKRIDGRFLAAVNGSRVEHILYWTRIGCRFPTSYDDQRAAVVRYNLDREIPDGALVRISVIDDDAERALSVMNAFAATLYAAARPTGKRLLSGTC